MSLTFEEKKSTLKNIPERVVAAVAYEALQKYSITSLPAVTLEFALGLNKWKNFKIVSLQEFCESQNYDLNEWLDDCDGYGIIYYFLELNCYAIFYNSELPQDLLNWTLATAIGYIEFGLIEVGKMQNISEQDILENFCYYFTAPDPVLLECDIRTASRIIKFCQIPFQHAFKKSKKLKSYTETAIEQGVKNLFKNFIEKFKTI